MRGGMMGREGVEKNEGMKEAGVKRREEESARQASNGG